MPPISLRNAGGMKLAAANLKAFAIEQKIGLANRKGVLRSLCERRKRDETGQQQCSFFHSTKDYLLIIFVQNNGEELSLSTVYVQVD